jgi:hypothetical protein
MAEHKVTVTVRIEFLCSFWDNGALYRLVACTDDGRVLGIQYFLGEIDPERYQN